MQAATVYRSAATSAFTAGKALLRAAVADFTAPALGEGLHVKVLRTAREREAIAGLRRHAAFDTENDLQLGLEPFEQKRDEIGHVVAVYRRGRVIASARAVPTGHGLTAAERMQQKMAFDASGLGHGSWEIGRMVMEQEDRDPALLQECLALCLEEFVHTEEVRHVHATTSTPAMARLWRRVGLRTLATGVGVSGRRYALVHAHVHDLMAALQVPHYIDLPEVLPVPARRPAARPTALA